MPMHTTAAPANCKEHASPVLACVAPRARDVALPPSWNGCYWGSRRLLASDAYWPDPTRRSELPLLTLQRHPSHSKAAGHSYKERTSRASCDRSISRTMTTLGLTFAWADEPDFCRA